MYFRIMSDLNLVCTRVSGNLVISEVLTELQKMSHHPSFDPNTNYLHDFRQIEEIVGSLAEHEKLADFSVSLASDDNTNVVFVIPDDRLSLHKYLEGYSLMSSQSNRSYWIYPNSKITEALEKVGLSEFPVIEGD